MEKGKKTKRGKKSKQHVTVMFIVASDGSFEIEPTGIWRSKEPRCFKSFKDPLRPMFVHYFSNKKAWMDSDIMESILSLLGRKMCLEKCKIVLFWNNATCHPETLQGSLSFYTKI